MIREILTIIIAPFVALFDEDPSSHPATAQLIQRLESYDNIDSIALIEFPLRNLKKMGAMEEVVPENVLSVEHSRTGIKKISKIISSSLIFPPDDILLCTNEIGYIVIYRQQVFDTIIVDDGAKFLRHKINGEQGFAYFEGDIWRKLAKTKKDKNDCGDK